MSVRERHNAGSGGYWRGDKWIAITWGDKIKESFKHRKKIKKNCRNCGDEFQVFEPQAKTALWCSTKCGYETRYTNQPDPIKKKAMVIGANLRMGKGKQDFIMTAVRAALGAPCRYCEQTITLENINCDHIEAYKSNAIRRNKAENREIRQHMDRRENLQMICKACNQLKGELDHSQFVALKEFLATDEWLEIVITRRLRMSRAPFGHRRKAS